MADGKTKTPRLCGNHCPDFNMSEATTKECRLCKNSFHLPCYGVSHTPAKLFFIDNIVFVCDACLVTLDKKKSSPSKEKSSPLLRQAVLSGTSGNIVLSQQQHPSPNNTGNAPKKATNEQLFALISSISKKMDKHNEEIAARLDEIGPDTLETKNGMKMIFQRLNSTHRMASVQNARDLAKEIFKPPNNINGNSTAHVNQTPKGRLYSTVLKRSTPVTSQPSAASLEMSGKRRRTAEIVMIDNSSAQTVKKAIVPSPKGGTKNIQIGKPLEVQKIEPKKVNQLSKSIWLSGFHPETTNEEIGDYIIKNTTITDTTKFKCSKLVKKDQDITKMSFISFKIDVSSDDFDTLLNPTNWPQHVKVREFIRMIPPKSTFGQYIPPSSRPSTPERQPKMMRTDNRNAHQMGTNPSDIEDHNAYVKEVASELNVVREANADGNTSSSPKN